MELTWEQKAKAMLGLTGNTGFSLKVRDDGSWYVHLRAERKEGGCLSSGCDSESTPQKAIEHRWEWLIYPKYYIVLNAYGEDRRAVKWNGFMWETIKEVTYAS